MNYTALHLSSEKGHTKIVELLLNQEDIDVNSKAILNLMILMIEFFRFFLMIFWTKIRIYYTPLHLAVDKNRIDIVQLLLNHEKIDVNAKTISIDFFWMMFSFNFFNTIQIWLNLWNFKNIFIILLYILLQKMVR